MTVESGSKGNKKGASEGIGEANNLAPVKPLGKPTGGAVKPLKATKQAQDFTDDKTAAQGNQFKSFGDDKTENKDGKQQQQQRKPRYNNYRGRYNKNYRRPVPKPAVEDLPEDIEYDEYTISPEDIICFNGQDNFLSTLYGATISVDGNDYASVEHYYQACKLFTLLGKEAAARTKDAATAIDVKKLAKKLLEEGKIPKDKIDEWKRCESQIILKHAMFTKFSENPELKDKLIATENKILVQSYARDNLFASGAAAKTVNDWATTNKGTTIKVPKKLDCDIVKYVPLIAYGKNLLGYLTMEVRREIVEQKDSL